MHTTILASEQLTTATHAEAGASEMDELARCGFTAEESVALFWLRCWYQSGGSDRMELVRNFEFLKWLVKAGKLTV
jgi:hypothetical protein